MLKYDRRDENENENENGEKRKVEDVAPNQSIRKTPH